MGSKKLNCVFLSLGSNLGDKLDNMERCQNLISLHIGIISKRSGVYKSEAWGFQSEHTFYNMCIEVKTGCDINELMEKIFMIEKKMGRMRSGNAYIDRIVDIDLLFFNHIVLNSPEIAVPHPRIEVRRFVLVPLAEISPGLVHPVLHRSIVELLEDCRDNIRVELI